MTQVQDDHARPADVVRAAFAPAHFGEWLQGRLGPEGDLVLVTLLCDAYGVHVHKQPSPDVVLGAGFEDLTRPVALDFLRDLGVTEGGTFSVSARFNAGAGTGVSTAGLVALARAAVTEPISETALARACLRCEGASDPLMLRHPDRVLWASRRAEIIRPLPAPPRVDVLGAFWGPAERTDPDDQDFPDISDVVSDWAQGPTRETACALATVSAERCRKRRGPLDDPSAQIAECLGALGYARAHTGSARAFLFAPGTRPIDGAERLRVAGYASPVLFSTGART